MKHLFLFTCLLLSVNTVMSQQPTLTSSQKLYLAMFQRTALEIKNEYASDKQFKIMSDSLDKMKLLMKQAKDSAENHSSGSQEYIMSINGAAAPFSLMRAYSNVISLRNRQVVYRLFAKEKDQKLLLEVAEKIDYNGASLDDFLQTLADNKEQRALLKEAMLGYFNFLAH